MPGDEGQFLACSFWLVSALAQNGRVDEARALFERLLGLSNDLGLLAEEYDVARERQVGNFPQAFSHLTLVLAARAIDTAEGRPESAPGGSMAGFSPSGEQFEISHRGQRATIVEVGGGVREYAVDGRAVLDPYPPDAICDGAHGAPLIPWPNRLADGRYSFDGVDYQVALTEPTKRNAIHGFLRWRSWRGGNASRIGS